MYGTYSKVLKVLCDYTIDIAYRGVVRRGRWHWRSNRTQLIIMDHLASLSNPLITIDQLSSSSSQLDGLSSELEASVRLAGVQLTQAAGILLRLPQGSLSKPLSSSLDSTVAQKGEVSFFMLPR